MVNRTNFTCRHVLFYCSSLTTRAWHSWGSQLEWIFSGSKLTVHTWTKWQKPYYKGTTFKCNSLSDFMWFKISLTNYFNDRWNGKEKHTCSGLILPSNINFRSGVFDLLWALNLFWESDNNHKKASGNSLSHLYSPNSLHTYHSANIFTDFLKAIFGSLVKNSLLHIEF